MRLLDWSSLKTRLIVTLFMSSLIPVLWLGGISYVALQNVFSQKIESGIQNTLALTRMNLENTLSNMEYVSLQMSQDGSVGQALSNLLASSRVYEQMQLSKEIERNMNLVNFTNPYLGVMLYYFSDQEEFRFNNREIRSDFSFKTLPTLAKMKGSTFFGPHLTAYKYSQNSVFSMIRPIDVPGVKARSVYVYIETNLLLFESILNNKQYGMLASHILLNQFGQVAYSDNPERFPPNSDFSQMISAGDYVYKEGSDQGWTLVVTIPKREFEQEFRAWLVKYGSISLSSIAISLVLALLVWRTLYKPIRSILREIRQISGNRFHSQPLNLTHIREFDTVLHEFDRMRSNLQELIAQIEQKERMKAHLEVEKLLYQINPHFIHNTLNTIQWIARMNGQADIDRLISIFTRVLHYNLGKEGVVVTLNEELGALKDYIELQRIRYDYQFDVRYDIDISLLSQNIPRFILQPIVENALYHGLGDESGIIEVNIAASDGYMFVRISDNGAGMSEEEVTCLLSQENKTMKAGLGIGLSYVMKMIKVYYGDHGKFQINSHIGQGTTMILQLPIGRMV